MNQKRCRDIPPKPDPPPPPEIVKIRLCKSCHDKAAKLGWMSFVLALARHGAWFCPFGKPDCGKRKINEF